MERLLPEVAARLSDHWVSAVLLLVTLSVVTGAALLRWAVRRRLRKLFAEPQGAAFEALPSPRAHPRDPEAAEVIRRLRREAWNAPEKTLDLSLDALTTRASATVRAVAAVYHPASPAPEYEASLAETLDLTRRVAGRLSRAASVPPLSLLARRPVSDYQRSYRAYRAVADHPVVAALQRVPGLGRAARIAWNMKNLANPLYWAGKEISREAWNLSVRWVHATLVSQVGREAARLYGGRGAGAKAGVEAGARRLLSLAQSWGGPDGDEWRAVIASVCAHPDLSGDEKAEVLGSLARKAVPPDAPLSPVSEAWAGWYRESLGRVRGAAGSGSALRERAIEREIGNLDG